jgi:hypothetical protein
VRALVLELYPVLTQHTMKGGPWSLGSSIGKMRVIKYPPGLINLQLSKWCSPKTSVLNVLAHLCTPVGTCLGWDGDEEPGRGQNTRANPLDCHARVVVNHVEPLLIWHGKLEKVACLEGDFAHRQVWYILEKTGYSSKISTERLECETSTYRPASSIAVREMSMPKVSSPRHDAM